MSKADKKVNCKNCGAEIGAKAEVCPSCGAKVKKPIYKKWWFWLIIAVIAVAIVAGSGDDAEKTPQKDDQGSATAGELTTDTPEIEYIVCDVTELFDALNDNALKAEKTYNGQYVEVTGHLGTIDSSGNYIGLDAGDNYDYLFKNVLCNIKSDEQLDAVMELSSGDVITIKGKIISVGEVLGYEIDIDSITKQ